MGDWQDDALYGPDVDFDSVDITNDFMFSYVMRDPEICLDLLNCLLPEARIRRIEYVDMEDGIRGRGEALPETQKALTAYFDRRGVRLDAYLDDGRTVYNIEMQTANQPTLAQRARLYQAHIDISQLQKGVSYDRLKPCFVIFICKFDPFGRGLYRYTFRNRCEECGDLLLNDGTSKLFFNTTGGVGEIAPELKALLNYMNDTRAYPKGEREDPLIRKIERAVALAKKDDDWRRNYMMLQVHLRDAERRGELRGEAIGARAKAVEVAEAMLQMELPLDAIARISGLTPGEIEALRQQSKD